jgi:hypothetical protein
MKQKSYKKYLKEKFEKSYQIITIKYYPLDKKINDYNDDVRFHKTRENVITITDQNGNFPLSNDGGVFWYTENMAESLDENEIDGKPNSNSKELFTYKFNDEFGLYDNNFKMKYGPFKNLEELTQSINNEEIPLEDVKRIN